MSKWETQSDGEAQYRVSIERIQPTLRIQVDEETSKILYTEVREDKDTIYEQTVGDLSVLSVICAVNGMKERDLAKEVEDA